MFRIKSILFSSSIILLIVLDAICCMKSEKKEALMFQRFTGTLVRLPKHSSEPATCGDWATACPAPESAVGDKLMKNALVVKEIYDSRRKTTEVEEKVCEDPYKIAVAFDIVQMNFRFGFAIYYEFSKEKYFRRSKLKLFMAPKAITDIMNKHSYLRSEESKIRKAVKNDNRDYNDEIMLNGNQRMEFTWIHMFNLRFDFSKKILRKITYSIFLNNKWPGGERCDDYSLGSEVYGETNDNYVDNLYDEEKQQEIFQNIAIPVRQCTDDGVCPVKSPCERKKNCLSKWLLIPKDCFTFASSSSVCSNLATIPIWTDKVEKVLKKVDQYLFSLHQITGEILLITSGVSKDVLKLPNTDGWFRKTSEIYLDPTKKKIPVPQIIYKLVKFRFRQDPNNSNINTDWYSVLIVIHNDPIYIKDTRICSENMTEKWGWQEITKGQDGGEFENVYVCSADGNELSKVMGTTSAAGQPPSRDLNLKAFPSSTIGDLRTADIKSSVDEMFHSISQHGMSQSSDAEMLERDEEIFPMSEDEIDDTEGEEKNESDDDT